MSYESRILYNTDKNPFAPVVFIDLLPGFECLICYAAFAFDVSPKICCPKT